jgi:hypothetical protein
MALIGLIGGPLAFVAATGVLFGVYEAGSSLRFLLTAPEIVWDFLLGVYLTVKGFKPSPILREGPLSAGTGKVVAGVP